MFGPNAIFSTFWEVNADTIFNVCIAVPIVVETALFIKDSFNNKEWVKDQVYQLKNFLLDNPLTALAVTSMCVAISTGVFFLTSSTFGMPIAVMAALKALQVTGQSYKNRDSIMAKVSSPFSLQPGETKEEAAERIRKNVLLGVGTALAVTAATVSLYYLVSSGLLVQGISKLLGGDIVAAIEYQIGVANAGKFWSVPSLVLDAIETRFTTTLVYLALGAAHAYKAYKAHEKDDTASAVFHAISSFISVVTLGVMASGLYEYRFHHLSYALLFQLAPFFPIQFLGSMLTLDSMSYWVTPYVDRTCKKDFVDIVQGHLQLFLTVYIAASIFEWLRTSLFEEAKKARVAEDTSDLANRADHNRRLTALLGESVG